MNLWYSILVSTSLWLNGGVVQYAPINGLSLDALIMTEITAEIGYGPISAYTSIITTMYPSSIRLSFSPQDNTYVIGGALTLGALTLGIEHECWHPMIAYQWVPGRSQVIPSYEGGGTRVYATLQFSTKL